MKKHLWLFEVKYDSGYVLVKSYYSRAAARKSRKEFVDYFIYRDPPDGTVTPIRKYILEK